MKSGSLTLDVRNRPVPRRMVRSLGATAELQAVEFGDPVDFDYRWTGGRHYLALHQIRLNDGETEADDVRRSTLADLRNRMTYAPPGCSISGWSSLKGQGNGYIALTYDTASLEADDDLRSGLPALDRPLVYFQSEALLATLSKIARAVSDDRPDASIYLEYLSATALLEVGRVAGDVSTWGGGGSTALSGVRSRRIVDYIEENFDRELTLTELADVAGLSKYHFLRAFKRQFGTTPHAFISARRMERARALLKTSSLSVAEVGRQSGYKTPEGFASSFRQATGMSPSAYRNTAIGKN